jgi:hypothetical protein
MTMEFLPNELLDHIYGYLPVKSRYTFASVNKRCRQIAHQRGFGSLQCHPITIDFLKPLEIPIDVYQNFLKDGIWRPTYLYRHVTAEREWKIKRGIVSMLSDGNLVIKTPDFLLYIFKNRTTYYINGLISTITLKIRDNTFFPCKHFIDYNSSLPPWGLDDHTTSTVFVVPVYYKGKHYKQWTMKELG